MADLEPKQTIYPSDSQDRADSNRWLFWCGEDFMPGASTLNWENSIKARIGLGSADPVEVARGELYLFS